MMRLPIIMAAFWIMSQFSTPSFAQEEHPCIPAKQAINNLLTNEFSLILYREEDNKLVALFANSGGVWVEVSFDMETACIVRGGQALYLVRDRKA